MSPTISPNVAGDEIQCGDTILSVLPMNDEFVYNFPSNMDYDSVTISLCNSFTDFATEIRLMHLNGTIIKTDELCEPLSENTYNSTMVHLRAQSKFPWKICQADVKAHKHHGSEFYVDLS